VEELGRVTTKKHVKEEPSPNEGSPRKIPAADDLKPESEKDGQNAWHIVGADQRRAHGRAIRKSQACERAIHCSKRGECGSKHTEEERGLFAMYPKLNFAMWKTKQCEKDSPHPAKKCGFAHGKEDAWCQHCTVYGHFFDSCSLRYG
jgi:hypothetical protein